MSEGASWSGEWFPQREFIYFDPRGTNGNSSLFTDPLDWLEDEDFARLAEAREQYRDGHEIADKGYVLIPLQLEEDTQIRFWSPFPTMEAFIAHCRRAFQGRKVIFRKHPKDKRNYECLTQESNGDLKKLICGASLVYGINSTVLLEAALIGKPVVTVGKSLLSIGPSRDHALAALLARQVPVGESDLSPWFDRGRGLDAPSTKALNQEYQPMRKFSKYPRQDADEFERFCQFVRELKPESLLEVGSDHGCSLLRLCEASMPTLKRVEVIDLHDGPWGTPDGKDDLVACIDHLRARGLGVTIHWLDSCSEEAGHLADAMEPFDFIFIDANHSLSAVQKDFARFYPKLRSGGWIAFHDVNGKASFKSKGRTMGVQIFWKELKESAAYQTMEIINPKSAFGIGLVRAATVT